MKTCPSCGAESGTVGVVDHRLCAFCLQRERVGVPVFEPGSEGPRKITQLINVDEELFCLCNDGTVWKWDHTDVADLVKGAPMRRWTQRWTQLPLPGET
jgi:alpha-tubulin suppressor-like RCC1 family protein